MEYCIASVIEGEIKEYYLKMTHELSDKFGIRDISKKIPAHITLKYPFFTEDVVNVKERTKAVADVYHATEFVVDGFDHFDQATIFLSLRLDKAFDVYIRNCVRDLGEFKEDRSFDPNKFTYHISIARHLTEDTFPKVWSYLQSLPRPEIKGSFDNLTLLNEIDNVWRVVERFEMGEKNK